MFRYLRDNMNLEKRMVHSLPYAAQGSIVVQGDVAIIVAYADIPILAYRGQGTA